MLKTGLISLIRNPKSHQANRIKRKYKKTSSVTFFLFRFDLVHRGRRWKRRPVYFTNENLKDLDKVEIWHNKHPFCQQCWTILFCKMTFFKGRTCWRQVDEIHQGSLFLSQPDLFELWIELSTRVCDVKEDWFWDVFCLLLLSAPVGSNTFPTLFVLSKSDSSLWKDLPKKTWNSIVQSFRD